MTLSHEQTKDLIEQFLKWDRNIAREQLHFTLIGMGSDEPEFYAGIITHGPGMRLPSDQWFELLSRLPNRLLRSQLRLDKILSEEHLLKLPPTSG